MEKIQKFECCLDVFIDYKLTNAGHEVYEIHWNYLACIFLFFLLFFPLRFFTSFFIILVVEPQTPLWNPLITRIRHLFLTYGIAKKFLAKVTWGVFGIFYFLHLRY